MYSYPYEKFSCARRTLMLPHPRGEEWSIMHAFHECSLALDHLKERGLDRLDDDLRHLVEKVQRLMDTSGLEDPGQEGLWMVKARKLGELERSELSQVVDELAFWFGDKA